MLNPMSIRDGEAEPNIDKSREIDDDEDSGEEDPSHLWVRMVVGGESDA